MPVEPSRAMSLRHSPLYFLRQGLSLIWPGWLASEPQGPAGLDLSSTGGERCHTLGSLCSGDPNSSHHRKHYPLSQLPPPPYFRQAFTV